MPAVNPSNLYIILFRPVSGPESMEIAPLIIDGLICLVQFHAPLSLAERVEQVEEPSLVVQNCSVLFR